jgi:predicted enzyme related to lactoylglutathione lyase
MRTLVVTVRSPRAYDATSAALVPHREEYEYGKFAWIVDPDGNRIELWEPPLSDK